MWESIEMKWQILLQNLLYNYLSHPTKYSTSTLSAIFKNSYKKDFNEMLPQQTNVDQLNLYWVKENVTATCHKEDLGLSCFRIGHTNLTHQYKNQNALPANILSLLKKFLLNVDTLII